MCLIKVKNCQSLLHRRCSAEELQGCLACTRIPYRNGSLMRFRKPVIRLTDFENRCFSGIEQARWKSKKPMFFLYSVWGAHWALAWHLWRTVVLGKRDSKNKHWVVSYYPRYELFKKGTISVVSFNRSPMRLPYTSEICCGVRLEVRMVGNWCSYR